MNKRYWILGAALVLAGGAVGFLAAPAHLLHASGPSGASTLTAVGQFTLHLTPTQAQLNIGDVESATTASQALAKNSAVTANIIKALESGGIKASEMATSGLNISPTYGSYSGNGTPPVTGYQASNSLTVTLNNVSQAGTVIDEATQAGANQINGISFGVSNPSSWYKKAYAGALKDALNQAEAVAKPLGEKILGIRSIALQNNNSGPVYYQNAASAAMAAAAVPVLPGQSSFSVQVTVVYRIGS